MMMQEPRQLCEVVNVLQRPDTQRLSLPENVQLHVNGVVLCGRSPGSAYA